MAMNLFPLLRTTPTSPGSRVPNQPTIKLAFVLGVLMIGLAGCNFNPADKIVPCQEQDALFCEDFEGIDPSLGGNQMVTSTAVDQWWVTRDDDQDFLYPDFPLAGRTQNTMILLSNGLYQDKSSSLLYTREIDLSSARSATLAFNIIYRTEKFWDGLAVFAVRGGAGGAKDPQNWALLRPRDGYPASVLFNGSLIPGYSGISARWLHQEFDLSSYLGGKLILGFYFSSDESLNDWGVGVDDIIVTADRGQIAGQTAGLTAEAIAEISFAQDPLISPELPRANLIEDTLCVMKEEYALEANQRVYIKAVSDTGQRVLVLHPGTGSLCWVDQADIWIEGEAARLPVLAERSRNTYFPVNSLAQTPVGSGAGCQSENPNPLPLYLHSALVEGGKITTLLFKPVLSGAEAVPPVDPRTGNPQGYSNLRLDISPGGELRAEINGSLSTCLSDWSHPGEVVCGDLALDPAGPLDLEICWQGWAETQACPLGYFLDPTSSFCVPLAAASGCQVDCGPGYFFEEQEGICLAGNHDDSRDEDQDYCPAGTFPDPTARRCLGIDYQLSTSCPAGYLYSPDTASCRELALDPGCPDGYTPASDSEGCVPSDFTAAPRCRSIEIQFPVIEATVKESTRCLKDPGNPNEIVSSLKAFDRVEILGLGEGGNWLVVTNPDYHIPCWADVDDFYLDQVDLSTQPIFQAEQAD